MNRTHTPSVARIARRMQRNLACAVATTAGVLWLELSGAKNRWRGRGGLETCA
ncbi:MAG TPA: hypothetical protein VE821_07945 [Pyrinomonadaceae bacterium]|nr:hypothetical protein [Pyrinomonadaceae bacterium]